MEDLTFVMPTQEEIVKMNGNGVSIEDGEHTATIVGIEEKRDRNDAPYFHFRYDIETGGYVKDYVAPKNPNAAASANKKLANMASAMLSIPPGATYIIDDFMYKTAIIEVENRESGGKIWPSIVNIRKVGPPAPVSHQNRQEVLKDYGIAAPQPSTSSYQAIVEDEIPF